MGVVSSKDAPVVYDSLSNSGVRIVQKWHVLIG